ncbi:MBL fold metallo-hydrolase [Alicyclobacillus sp. SO9]|nr:MBL fold metallo-hydrolase [Alicyclobacillus sp. SO9]
MKIADGVEMLQLQMNMMGNTSTINPTLLYDENHAVLVDVGMPGELDALKAAVEQAGVPFNRIDGVILTHQDLDHVGGIQDVLQALDKPVEVYAHPEDQPYIEGDKEPIKMTRENVDQLLERLPQEVHEQVKTLFSNLPTAKVTETVYDGEVLPLFGGVQVIYTPGHTPGHISLYHQPSKTLIAGDATVSENGKIIGPNPQATLEMPIALDSEKKFAMLDISKAICYHGGLCESNVNEQFRQRSEN